ncbi:hypothetical protein BOTBODRAFT_189004 [Botryobasidium botryosum FD-172 SS1]|uniref:Uncharacterized protein n=1 Tax=Botryobasidium botryosum (strain FD-172 SS1) TaxID=930990 RepID=A0A067MMC6_BOTB1|nr:hypothetical protein BOTBODRAFT_189004 [Botryobasidium botryosum FD-172 SS1]
MRRFAQTRIDSTSFTLAMLSLRALPLYLAIAAVSFAGVVAPTPVSRFVGAVAPTAEPVLRLSPDTMHARYPRSVNGAEPAEQGGSGSDAGGLDVDSMGALDEDEERQKCHRWPHCPPRTRYHHPKTTKTRRLGSTATPPPAPSIHATPTSVFPPTPTPTPPPPPPPPPPATIAPSPSVTIAPPSPTTAEAETPPETEAPLPTETPTAEVPQTSTSQEEEGSGQGEGEGKGEDEEKVHALQGK